MGAKVRVNWGQLGDGRAAKLWAAYNSNHNSLYVLAPDRSTALEIAYGANHIHRMWDRKDKSYPHAEEIEKPWGRDLEDHWNLIEVAMMRGEQGTVHFDDGQLLIGNKTFRV